MSLDLLVVAAAVATLALVALAILAPTDRARALALVGSVVLVVSVAQNSAPSMLRNGAYVLGIAVLVLAELRSSRRARGSAPLVAAIAGWWGLVLLVVALTQSYNVSALLLQAAFVLTMVWSISRATSIDLSWLVTSVLVLAAAQTVLGVAEVFGGVEPVWGYRGGLERENPFQTDLVRAQGTMGHPIVLGYLEGLAVVLAWANPFRLRQAVRLPLLGAAVVGVVLSGTRSAVLVAAIAITAHIVLRLDAFRLLRGLFLLLAAAVLVAVLDFGLTQLALDTIDSGSWVHRLGSLQAVPNLLGREGWELWWGSGYGSERELFSRGYIVLTYGLPVVDNFFVYLLGTTGIVGLALTLAILVFAFLRGQRYIKAAVIYVTGMFFSFDTTVWFSSGVLMFVVLAIAASHQGGGEAGRQVVRRGRRDARGVRGGVTPTPVEHREVAEQPQTVETVPAH
ncbi:hypothetical protein [Microbacterium sp. SLBN-146]|uniref:hypothetical protein n=1 Tax=Microbacterium sp. SLBN-146 TaxID=2768457 RepID=UPI001150B9CE|nr:hypothetical protein [Microbacterium sp. SLBN-146]TQJ30871.1 O-antigen ligase [Microbacterium sp. SLBN-146]